MLIVFEGIEGSGKTTQARLLYNYLRKRGRCVLLNEPSDGIVGRFVKNILAKHTKISPAALQLLFAADRAEDNERAIGPKLDAGFTVICERYIASNIAYGTAQGLPSSWLHSLNKNFLQPDMTFLTSASMKNILKRLKKEKKDRAISKKTAFLKKVNSEYHKLKRGFSDYHIIDTNRSIDEAHKKILEIVFSKTN